MERVFIFDVDGTLTGPRRYMHEDFARFFRTVVASETVYLVSGSDMPKLEDQLPVWLLQSVAGVFACSGNEFWQGGNIVFQMNHAFPDELIELAEAIIAKSAYSTRTGNHCEVRTGALNISVVGRNANPIQRNDYERYDQEVGERKEMIAEIEKAFSDYEANSGGQISIDVSPKGWNKSRVQTEVRSWHPDAVMHFFGDNIFEGGNDLPLAEAIQQDSSANQIYPVSDHYDTWRILQDEFVLAKPKDSDQVA